MQTKCDGADTCKSCRTRNRVCEYPETVTDNASSSRQQMATLGALCEKMESLIEKLTAATDSREALQHIVGLNFGSHHSGMPLSRGIPDCDSERRSSDPDEELLCDIVRRGVSKPARDKTGHMVMDSYGNFR